MKTYVGKALYPALASLLAVSACSGGGEEQANGSDGTATEVTLDESLSVAENIAAEDGLSEFNDLITRAGLTEALGGIGPYTVFAPANGSFDTDAHAESEMPELVALVSYHIVPGLVTAEDLRNAIETEGGSIELATMTGANLTVSADEDGMTIRDGAGNDIAVTQPDLPQQNGVVHVVDGMFSPG